jgi:carbon storage regulator CsrA
MLVLSRKRGESIVAPDAGLRVTVLRVAGSKVVLGIASLDGKFVKVVRGELLGSEPDEDRRTAKDE